MKKYKVVFALSYEIEADNEIDAEDKASEVFCEEVDNSTSGLTEIFGCNVEEI